MDATPDSGLPAQAARRSPKSLQFEAFWKSLPRKGLLPHKQDFQPGGIGPLLRNVMLIEANLALKPSLPLRLIGSALVERIGDDIRGHDYLEFLDPSRHIAAIKSVRLMLEYPCGLWQITPIHYQRGFAQNVESTVFPMLGDPAPALLSLVMAREDLVRPLPSAQKVMLAGGSDEFEFLDIGAGVPAWPPK